ncbi:WAT1-related protein-like [Iris pallida]|uniref:WAT1-related protein n=1 Tax=Iris pallida TaxID=29817 RepID=A0AAX6H2T4_IRIPA|nr:WAT1-related protein-like [Iris pallida]
MDERKPYVVVLVIQLLYTGLYIISKVAFDEGMSTFIFIFYRQAAATVLLLPLAFIFERKTAPPISALIVLKIFMLALLGITFSLNVYNVGLKYTSATVASAVTNSVPIITFFLALILRMETVKLKSASGIAKVLGVALCLSGIMTIAFYVGPKINPLNHHHLFSHKSSNSSDASTPSSASWVKGTFLMITANTTWSLWLVLQGMLLREYSSKVLLTTFQCLFSTIQTFIVAMVMERDLSRWKLRLDMGLLAVAYCGFVITGITFYLQAWCIEKKGPVFQAMSTPLALVFTIICSFFIGETIHLGSILGGILMVVGLYSVLWGKSKEATVKNQLSVEEKVSTIQETELSSPFRSPF